MSESPSDGEKVRLWQKLYTQEHYTELVRIVGYQGLPIAEALEKMRDLIAKHGKEKLQLASKELFDMATTDKPFVCLKAETRKLAWQLLGPPPEHKPVDMYAEIMASGERLKSPKPEEQPKNKPKRNRKKKEAARAAPTPPEPETTNAPVPLMQQYRDAKERHPGMMLLFRIGDFYELYEDDAKTAAALLGLTLTTRDKDTMAGFPHHSLEGYLHKLLKAGHRVAICDHVEDSLVRGPIRREVTHVVTPGKMAEDEPSSQETA